MLKVEEEIMTPGDDHHHPGLFSSFGSVDLSFFASLQQGVVVVMSLSRHHDSSVKGMIFYPSSIPCLEPTGERNERRM